MSSLPELELLPARESPAEQLRGCRKLTRGPRYSCRHALANHIVVLSEDVYQEISFALGPICTHPCIAHMLVSTCMPQTSSRRII